jgi:hypothetical protein
LLLPPLLNLASLKVLLLSHVRRQDKLPFDLLVTKLNLST